MDVVWVLVGEAKLYILTTTRQGPSLVTRLLPPVYTF